MKWEAPVSLVVKPSSEIIIQRLSAEFMIDLNSSVLPWSANCCRIVLEFSVFQRAGLKNTKQQNSKGRQREGVAG